MKLGGWVGGWRAPYLRVVHLPFLPRLLSLGQDLLNLPLEAEDIRVAGQVMHDGLLSSSSSPSSSSTHGRRGRRRRGRRRRGGVLIPFGPAPAPHDLFIGFVDVVPQDGLKRTFEAYLVLRAFALFY